MPHLVLRLHYFMSMLVYWILTLMDLQAHTFRINNTVFRAGRWREYVSPKRWFISIRRYNAEDQYQHFHHRENSNLTTVFYASYNHQRQMNTMRK
jgi:hypothetical protein